LFEMGGYSYQKIFAAVGGDNLHADGQAGAAPAEGEADRGVLPETLNTAVNGP